MGRGWLHAVAEQRSGKQNSRELDSGWQRGGDKASLGWPLPLLPGAPAQLALMRPFLPTRHLQKYPIVWQGLLALKNDTAAVQLHFVSGNNVLAHRSLPAPEGGPPLRIAQRMRLEASQLEGVARRMMVRSAGVGGPAWLSSLGLWGSLAMGFSGHSRSD